MPAAMPDIGREPDYGLSRSAAYRKVESQFGDGYAMRMRDGINTTVRSWNVTWSVIDKDSADVLMGFFEQMGGVDSFYWIMPDTGEQVTVITDSEPSLTYDGYSNHTVTVTLKEVFGV